MSPKCISCGKLLTIKETRFIARGVFETGIPACEECKVRIESKKTVRDGKSSQGRC